MSSTDDKEARRAYMAGALDQLNSALKDRSIDRVMHVVRKMRHDGYRAEAAQTIRFLVEASVQAMVDTQAAAKAKEVKVVFTTDAETLAGALRILAGERAPDEVPDNARPEPGA